MTPTIARPALAVAALLALSCGGKSTPPDATYTLEVRYRQSVDSASDPAALKLAVDRAANRIRAIITAGLVPVAIPGKNCVADEGTVRFDETVRGLVVLVSYIDLGNPSTLASSGPCIVRSSKRLPLVSVLQFNSTAPSVQAAVANNNTAYLETIALHEFFHTLGFGTIWKDFPFLVAPGSPPLFKGARALAAAKELNQAPPSWLGIPVEDGFGPGTVGSHWRELDLGNELMTGVVSEGGRNPLSAASIASLQDLGYHVQGFGYHVDLGQADEPAYAVPGTSLRALAEGEGISFGDDVIRRPPVEVDDTGELP